MTGETAGDADERLTLEVPPEPGFLAIARLFTAAVARHFGCSEDSIGDLKIAVSEACSNAIEAHQAAGVPDPVRVTARLSSGELLFEIHDRASTGEVVEADAGIEAADAPAAVRLAEGSLRLAIIRSIVGGAEIVPRPGGGAMLRFAVPLDPGAGDGPPPAPEPGRGD